MTVDVVGCGEHFHSGLYEERVYQAHDGGCLDEQRAGAGHGAFYQFDGQAQGSELGVKDDPRDGSYLTVYQVGSGAVVGDGGVAEVRGDVTQLAVQRWHGIYDHADQSVVRVEPGSVRETIQAEGRGDGAGRAAAVVELGELFVFAEGAASYDQFER